MKDVNVTVEVTNSQPISYPVSFYMGEVCFPQGTGLYRNTLGTQTLDGIFQWVAFEHKRLKLKGKISIVRQNESLWFIKLSSPCDPEGLIAGSIFAKPKAFVEALMEQNSICQKCGHEHDGDLCPSQY